MVAADTAWMLISAALVLLMTPALAFFYGGLVRSKNALNTMMMSFISLGFVGVVWAMLGYSLAFAPGNDYLGSVAWAFLRGVGIDPNPPSTIPHYLFMSYQGTFAIITAALISGAIVERMRFSAYVAFITLWVILVYAPIAHWVWGGGFLGAAGVLDFAGGTVVHLNAGVAGIVAAYMLGPRKGYGSENLAPFDLSLAVIGTGMLWVGWFGFNGGSALGANGRAVMAIVCTHLAASAGAFTWMALEWWTRGKPSVLGMISGAVAGLGTITPASGFVLPMHGIIIGIIAGGVCFWACTWLKLKIGYDDSLDVFGVHGIGGFTGTLLTGVFATAALPATAVLPKGVSGLLEGNGAQVLIQLEGIVVTLVWSAVATFIILKVIGAITALRVSELDERQGLDVSLHGEALQ
jgi:Amt family ammonium transporter